MNQLCLKPRGWRKLSAGLFLLACCCWAQEPLSPAEQEAQETMQSNALSNERLLAMCHHILLYSSDEQKASLLTELGNKTCSKAVADGDFAPSANN